jgi:hypothetical protein
MAIDKKILKEISRFNSINKYISEQVDPALDAALAPPVDPAAPVDPMAPVDPNAAPADPNAVAPIPPAAPIDIATDPEVEELGAEGEEEENKEELDVTDLVASQKNMEQKQDEYYAQARRLLGGKTKKRNKSNKRKSNRRSNKRRSNRKRSRRY